MLEQFNDRISMLCANSSTIHEVRESRHFFSIDGIFFDSFWYSSDNYRFGTSERPSYIGATLRTPSATVAKYELLRLLGDYYRWSRSWRAIELPNNLDSIQDNWAVTSGKLFGEQTLSMLSRTGLIFTSSDHQRSDKLANLMQHDFEDALQLYLKE